MKDRVFQFVLIIAGIIIGQIVNIYNFISNIITKIINN